MAVSIPNEVKFVWQKGNTIESLRLAALSCNPVERYVHFLQGSTKWSSIYKKSNYMENPKLRNLFVWKSENKIKFAPSHFDLLLDHNSQSGSLLLHILLLLW